MSGNALTDPGEGLKGQFSDLFAGGFMADNTIY